jgi:chromosome segregation ATPase
VTSSAESALLSEEIKAKLQEVLQLLNQDIGQLVQDGELIRAILRSLKGILLESIEEALHPAAYIESHQISVLKAQKRLSDRLHQEQTIKQRDDLKNLVDVTRGKIVSLTQSNAAMELSKRDLEAKRDRLIKELERVNQEIADVDNRLSQLPTALQQLEVKKQEQARQTYQLHKSIKTVPGSAEADVQEIQIADNIPLRAISVIQNALGSL